MIWLYKTSSFLYQNLIIKKSGRNLAGAYIKIFTGVFISHTAQNRLVSLVAMTFLCLGVCYNG